MLRGDHVRYLEGSLLVCVDAVVLPIVLAHELRVGVETGPAALILGQDLLDVHVVLAGTSIELAHFSV